MTSPLAVFCLCAVLPGTLNGATTQAPGDFGLAMTRLELSLDLDYDEGSLTGWAAYQITNFSESDVTEVPFNLGRLMTVVAALDAQGDSLAFTQEVAAFTDSPRRQVDHVVVTLPHPLTPGATVRLRLDYGGYLVGYTETGSLYIQDKVDKAFSILREDAFAWPSLGTLTRRANRGAPRPDFTFTASITVPTPLTVASGGRLLKEQTTDGRTTFVYESTAPVPFLNLPIADYRVIQQSGVRVYSFPQDSIGADQVLTGATRGLALLERWFGPLATAPDLAVMEIPEMWGSQASVTGGIIQTADAFRDITRMPALYHELTHLWNAPDRDKPSARWNEGLAAFLAQRMARDLDGRNGMGENVKRTSSRLLAQASSAPGVAEIPFIRYGEAGVTDLSYRVGFLMFYALHRVMGEEQFDAALRDYYQEHRIRGGTFEEFIASLEAHSSVDLSGFFRDWVYTTGWFEKLRNGEGP